MVSSVVMRCGLGSIVLCEIGNNGTLLHATAYAIKFDGEQNDTDGWLRAFATAVARIPKNIRKRITFIVPPNREIFTKHLEIPDLEGKGIKEAFRFECEHEFPGGSEAWCWDIYQTKAQTTRAFAVAIRRTVYERIIDALISNKIQFSHICPEILLNTIAIQNCAEAPQDSMIVHLGKTSSYLSCIGNGVEYFRMLPIAGAQLTKTIAESQKVSIAAADALQSEFLKNLENENRTFMMYYAKQFSQKLRRELKRSELFYCRTFKQNPTVKLYLTGCGCCLYKFFKGEDSTEIVDVFDKLKDNIDPEMSDDEIDLIRWNIGAFVGAAYCLKNKQAKFLNLFSADFSDQVEFQRQHFGYLLVAVLITLATLTWLKVLKRDIVHFDAERAALRAKLLETNVDIDRYDDLDKERSKLNEFIRNAKTSLYSQAAWMTLLSELQNKVAALKTAWVESLKWGDRKDGTDNNVIAVDAKMLFFDKNEKKSANERIAKFLESLGSLPAVVSVNGLNIGAQGDNVVSFSFVLTLGNQSEIIAR
ncbi:MAG: hypothetical protein LBR91_00080 [Puniceicoccales bacterium]|jgi:Tfp pilus assembly PilM family ATPase|nr:hypothetical protein [Puniceicoccales bacterium]